MEIGHLYNLLKKGNINAIWATLSPIKIATSYEHLEISQLVEQYPTKAIMPSLEGMVMSQLTDAEKRGKVRDPKKSILTAARTVRFGWNLWQSAKYKFEPVTEEFAHDDVLKALQYLKELIAADHNLVPAIDAHEIEELLLSQRREWLNQETEWERCCD
jgi:hypothetical protein